MTNSSRHYRQHRWAWFHFGRLLTICILQDFTKLHFKGPEGLNHPKIFSFQQSIRDVVNENLAGEMDRPLARLTLRGLLQALGYQPTIGELLGGFDGDQSLPDAVEGTLQDLSSDRRLNLILETQERLMLNAGLRERGPTSLYAFPRLGAGAALRPADSP
jgi:hypothetical protein